MECCVISHFAWKLYFHFNYQNIDDSFYFAHCVSFLIMHTKMANKLLAPSINMTPTQYALNIEKWKSLQKKYRFILLALSVEVKQTAQHSDKNRWHNTGLYMRKLIHKEKRASERERDRVNAMGNAIALPFAIGQMPMLNFRKMVCYCFN